MPVFNISTMARQWRIEFPGAIYHVLSRGNGGQDIFLSHDDRHLFLNLLEELSERFNVEVYGYVLMRKKTGELCLLKWNMEKGRNKKHKEIT